MGRPKAVPQYGGPGLSSPGKRFKFQVPGNAISAILRQRQHVFISHFLKVKITFFFIKI